MRQVALIGAALLATGLAIACSSGGGGGGGLPAANCSKTQPAGFPVKPIAASASAILVNSSTAPDFPGGLVDQNGNLTCLRAYSGKVVLINVAAGWCPPCNQEMPAIEQAMTTYGPQGFVVLQPMLDSYVHGGAPDANFVQQWIAQYGITFYVVPDHNGTAYNTYLASTDPNYGYIPLSVIVDRDQIVRDIEVGGTGTLPGGGIIPQYVNTPAQLKYSN